TGGARCHHGFECLSAGIQSAKIAKRSLTTDETRKRRDRWNKDSRSQGNDHSQTEPDSSPRPKTRRSDRIVVQRTTKEPCRFFQLHGSSKLRLSQAGAVWSTGRTRA